MEQLIPWTSGTWRNPPVRCTTTPTGQLRVEALAGSDAWQRTAYGFRHANEHALLAPFAEGQAVEVDLIANQSEEFDQGGLLLRVDDAHWIKAGLEFADGHLGVGAVVTNGYSDWSTAPVDHWACEVVRIRASWLGDAVTIRAGLVTPTGSLKAPLRLIRLAPWRLEGDYCEAGPYLCAPTRAGLEVEFTRWRLSPPDATIH